MQADGSGKVAKERHDMPRCLSHGSKFKRESNDSPDASPTAVKKRHDGPDAYPAARKQRHDSPNAPLTAWKGRHDNPDAYP